DPIMRRLSPLEFFRSHRCRSACLLSTVAVLLLVSQGCVNSNPPAPSVTCPAGQHVLGTSCAWDFVTVNIGPSVFPQGVAWAGCPQFSPNPVSAHTNGVVQWTNN